MGISVPMAMMAASAGMNAVGSYNQSKAQKQSLEFQSSVAANNATLAGYQEHDVENQVKTDVQNVQLRGDQVYGAQRASMAANGVDLGEGSANNVLASTKYMTDRDAATAETNALKMAWGYKTQATDYTSNAAALRAGASGINPTMSAATSLLTSATQYNSTKYAMSKAGVQ